MPSNVFDEADANLKQVKQERGRMRTVRTENMWLKAEELCGACVCVYPLSGGWIASSLLALPVSAAPESTGWQ